MIVNNNFLDSSDYIGCFKNFVNLLDSFEYYSSMTPCYCIGYCNTLGYSLAAIGKNYGYVDVIDKQDK